MRTIGNRMDRRCWIVLIFVWSAVLWPNARAAEGVPDARFGTRVKEAYLKAREAHEKSLTNREASLEFARTSFDWGDFATSDAERESLAKAAIAACQSIIAADPASAAAHYYLALNLGQLARTKLFTALHLLDEMEAALLQARKLDSKFDYGGPDRSIGILYRDAPGWPVSLGSKNKARQHLSRAVELFPDYPDNQVTWLEALQKWNDRKAFEPALEKARPMMEKARKTLTGFQWEQSWADWDQRWAALIKWDTEKRR
jgi:tetratricopeptide (TPR) repeat protein